MNRAITGAICGLLLIAGLAERLNAQKVTPQFYTAAYDSSHANPSFWLENGTSDPNDTGFYYSKIQSIYLPGYLGRAPSGRVQNIYLQVGNAPYASDTLPYPQHLQLKMGYTEMTVFPNTAAQNFKLDTFLTTLTKVVDKDTSVWPKNLKYISNADWVKIPVTDSSFSYIPSRNLVVEVNCRTKNPRNVVQLVMSAQSAHLGSMIAYGNYTYVTVPDTAQYGYSSLGAVVSLGFDLIPTGISELSNIRGIGLFPNPAPAGHFNISLDARQTMKEVSITVTDVTGREVLSRQFSNPGKSLFEEINLSGTAPGMYFVRITADGEAFTRRVSVE